MFEPNQYRELCSELHVSEEKLEEVIQMTEQEKKRKFHRPMPVSYTHLTLPTN